LVTSGRIISRDEKADVIMNVQTSERVQTVVIGGGQAGLSVGYHLARRKLPFVILDAHARVGDAWRLRWDSLRLFSPNRYNGIDGMPFPGPPNSFCTKDEMADYLESYAKRFNLPVRTGVRVDRLSREGRKFIISAGDRRFEADNVIVAMANYQVPRVPPMARELKPGIVQLHSRDYKGPAQLQPGGVLVVGAGNSGAEIAIELRRQGHPVWVSGQDVGEVPFKHGSFVATRVILPILFRVVFHRLLSIRTPIGRKARRGNLHGATPLIRTRRRDLAAAGVEFVARVTGTANGLPKLADGRVLEGITNVIWSSGFTPGFSWIDLPVLDEHGEPKHQAGVVTEEPGLFFVGLHFLFAMSSAQIQGVGRDADRIAKGVAVRVHAAAPVGVQAVAAVS
jgi:putative flavoprotein involved in K+ transport